MNAALSGRPRFDLTLLIPADDLERLVRGAMVRHEFGWPDDDGTPIWFDATFSSMTDLAGRPEKIVMCAVDVTQRRLAVDKTNKAMQVMLDRMATIVGNLDRITRTTNMLALNAGVQAARAGEHGAGFAVVATEIRTLADQSEKAVAEIHRLIGQGRARAERIGKVEGGQPDTDDGEPADHRAAA